jgi:hypothetical protein
MNQRQRKKNALKEMLRKYKESHELPVWWNRARRKESAGSVSAGHAMMRRWKRRKAVFPVLDFKFVAAQNRIRSSLFLAYCKSNGRRRKNKHRAKPNPNPVITINSGTVTFSDGAIITIFNPTLTEKPL